MYALHLGSYKWETIGQFDGAVVSVDYSDNVLYRCQKHPSGLYKTILKAGKFDMISERRLFSGKRILNTTTILFILSLTLCGFEIRFTAS